MGVVTFDISISLDGYVAGPNDGPKVPLGENGERIHQWIYELASWREQHGLAGGKANSDSDVIGESSENVGAIVMGRRMYNNGERYWGDNPPFYKPVYVLTHEPKEKIVKEGGTTFYFSSEGIESALNQAKRDAGSKDVSIAGGANVIQQYIKAGLIDEFQVHIVPVLLGDGIRLFDFIGSKQIELEKTRVIDSPSVTHLKYRIIKK
ncbi:dihydrofolate reductase [Ornithinibacillus sp. L9]|uniref:Dihydrofolate reductase n=1 Tax=Ornithinibacillus caprae TaxID=2678566 RepID=A0A6N8FKU0_9BACI|nr:dihydrofolate reductase family protein [Ornithinibacillus caprae]MUK88607.1 dihydrofolate reductase [Ornithinibacillus caprae]